MIAVKSSQREELIDITAHVSAELAKSGVQDGVCNVFCLHTSAALLISENYDEGIKQDLLDTLRKLIPEGGHRHDQLDGNADSHMKSSIIQPSLTVPVRNGKLHLGQWQGIMFAEFSGPREREVEVTVVGK